MKIRNAPCLGSVIAVSLMVLPTPAGAQTSEPTSEPTVLTFCYAPRIGAVYRIKAPGTRTSCLTPRHVEFSVTDGIPDGSVGTAKLADGAVGTDKIQDAAVTLPKLAFDATTQDEFDLWVGQLGLVGVLNLASNPVHWSQLKGVPEGFADGLDDSGGDASDLDCVACVENEELAADAVTSAKIADGAVGADDIGSGVIRGGLGGHILGRSITGISIAEGGVELSNIANGAVRDNHIFPGAVSSNHLANGAVTRPKLADDAVTAAKIDDDAISGAHVLDGSLTTADIGVSSGTFQVDFPLFDPGRCRTVSRSPSGLDANDVVVVTRGPELQSDAATMAVQRDGSDSFEIRICNTAPGFFDPGPISFSYVVFEVP